ncbi:ElyC/SanA/YdcF family protein [Fibrobacterota bacterium]
MAEPLLNRLILVPGHGVCVDPGRPADDHSWAGNFPGEGSLYLEHIREGIKRAAEDTTALLVFSGGQTREEAGPRSEAQSYRDIAEHALWWGHESVSTRVKKEEYARDSFENLLFSLALFRRECGAWPHAVTVVGWKFKQERYGLHKRAIRLAPDNFLYAGINNPVGAALAEAEKGEKEKVKFVKKDMFLKGSEWASQRRTRDPFNRKHIYYGIDEELDEILYFLADGN